MVVVKRVSDDAVEIDVVVADVGGCDGTRGGVLLAKGEYRVAESGGREVELVETGEIGFFDTICREYVG
jgi:hypothetical protein